MLKFVNREEVLRAFTLALQPTCSVAKVIVVVVGVVVPPCTIECSMIV